MDVLSVVILSGFVSPAKVELVCLAACNACRESSAAYSLVVKDRNIHLVQSPRQEGQEGPSSYFDGQGDTIPQCHGRISPHRRISRLLYNVDLPLPQVAWPAGLRALRFGWTFDHPLDAPLPASLVSLELGGSFNHHIEGVAWPPRLTLLRFGDRFNRQVELAAWPATLRELTFGSSFDQPIESVEWPPALEVLRLGDGFNHPVRGVEWAGAASLRRLEFGSAFRCAVGGVAWPSGLRVLKFGACFDQPLDAGQLPGSLRLLHLPDLYAMHDEFEPDRLPEGCRLRIDRTEMFDLTY
ncbi:unnamed protein product [Scytosiphon promiscuus]